MKNNNITNLLTIGADVEMFLKNIKNDEIISAEGLVKGTKNRPYHYDKKNKWFSTQLDNVLAELTIPPAKTSDEFARYLIQSIDYLNKSLPEDIVPEIVASANLNEKYLMTEQAQTFGYSHSRLN